MSPFWPIFKKRSRSALYSQEQSCFESAYLEQLTEALLASPYLAQNVLNYRFASTEGFSVIFQSQQRDRVLADFPYFEKYLEALIQPEYNLYYLNALALRQSAKVERHIDHSIRGYCEDLPFPKQVSVLYLSIPAMQGGQLQLYDPQENHLLQIEPKTGLWFHFRGDLKHAITSVQALSEHARPRLSLVCEQYQLTRSELEYVPEFVLKSTVGFNTFLEAEF
jgi:hypothetical protein